MTLLYCSQGHDNPGDSRFCHRCGEPLPRSSSAASSGNAAQTVGFRYRLIRDLGQGGFGRTYLAEDTNRFHELCVLKEFAPQVQGPEALEKAEALFEREAGILYKLQHPQIPRFREMFQAEWQGKGRLFLVQDYIEGETYQSLLQTRMNEGRAFTEPEVTQFLGQILPVLDYIHSCGVIHRDISPDNLIRRSTDGLSVLIDFGGVKQAAATVNSRLGRSVAQPHSVTRLGKAGYAPDEQLDTGEVFPHSDLYALAVTVLVLLTGKEPQALLGNGRRQWQREVRLSADLKAVLNHMLDPIPAKRYQSAQAVLTALKIGPAPDPSSYQSNAGQPAASELFPATLAVAPAQYNRYPQSRGRTQFSIAPSTGEYPSRRPSGLRTIAVLLFLALAVGSLSWWVAHDWRPLKPTQPQTVKPTPSKGNGASAPEFSKAEQERKQALGDRREALGVDAGFLSSLVNAAFYAKHPDRNGRQLSKGPEDKDLRAEWDQIAGQYLNQLEAISADARSRLGRYTLSDVSDRQAAVNQLNLSSRALNDLTDARFYALFPDQPRNQNLLNRPIGQVWQAIAADQLKALQAGTTLETIQFPQGQFSDQVNGTLKPGEGKAYTVRLMKGQTIRVQLQAPDRATRLSIYPPTSQSPALLEDSSDQKWSGTLTESGFYEVVVVATTPSPVSYELGVAAADDIKTPSQ